MRFEVDASVVAAVESAVSANTAELVAMKISAAAAHDAAGALESLDIRITPQKLNECEPLPIARAVHFARQRFSLGREVRGCGGEGLRRRSPHIEALLRAPERSERAAECETSERRPG